MARIVLFLCLLVLVLFWALGRRKHGVDRPSGLGGSGTPRPALQPMVACTHCGLHLPQAEARQDGEGRWFCSEEHRARGPQT